MAGIRPFQESDAPIVAGLIWKVLHNQTSPAPASLDQHLRKLFLRNPWLDEGIASRVFEDTEGKIIGFFGAVPRRMIVKGQVVKLAFGSNFVVDQTSRASMIAIQLVKTFLKGSQDVSITDSANDNSRPILRSLGFATVPAYSLSWIRPLRPTQFGFYALGRMKKSAAVRRLGTAMKPMLALVDSAAAQMRVSPLRQAKMSVADEDLDDQTLLACLQTIPAKHWLVPEYDLASLTWVLDFVTERNALGTVRKQLVRGEGGKIIGWYIYTLGDGKSGAVLQVGAESPSVGVVLDHLFRDAWQQGLLAVEGRMEPNFMQELTSHGCFFFRQGSWTLAQSSNPEFLSLLHSGTAFFSRLDGEWCLRHGSVGA